MAKAPKATTFSSRSNAKRAAEKAIEAGTAPSIDYGIKEDASGRHEIVWHLKGDGSCTSAGETQIPTATVEVGEPAHTIATGSESLGEVEPLPTEEQRRR
jgi:hypothetical protein